MSITIACPYCQTKLKASEKMVGRSVQCPNCRQTLRVGGDGAPPATTDPFVFNPGAAPPAAAPPAADVFAPATEEPLVSGPARRPGAFMDYLLFRRMITPIVIHVIFWLGVLVFVGFGIFTMVGALLLLVNDKTPRLPGQSSSGAITLALFGFISGLLQMTLGPFVWRLYCELLIVLFRIYEELRDIKDKLGRR